jgi:hypothetical protein
MIGTSRFKATFKDLAAAVQLSYHGMKRGKLVSHLLKLRADEVDYFHYPKMTEYGPQGNLWRLPKVILEILRHTIVPTIGWYDRALEWLSMEIVNVVLSGDPLNMLDWMVNQMLECKRNVGAPLILQPYIMALMLRTVRGFHGAYDVTHGVCIPFLGKECYLSRDSSLVALGVLRLHLLGMSKFSFLLYSAVLALALIGMVL